MLGWLLDKVAGAVQVFREWRERERRFFLGLLLVGGLAGVHLGGPLALTVQYHPNNEFETGDAIGLGFGEENRVYGQEGILEYHNLDEHTVLGAARIYLLGPLYVGFGGAHQRGSSRSVTFDRRDRLIGDTVYTGMELTVRTRLMPQTAPVMAAGAHVTAGGVVGLMAESNFGLANAKQIQSIEIITNQPLDAEDEWALRLAIVADAESEDFGIATVGPTFGVPLGGMGGVVPWSIAAWWWRRRRRKKWERQAGYR